MAQVFSTMEYRLIRVIMRPACLFGAERSFASARRRCIGVVDHKRSPNHFLGIVQLSSLQKRQRQIINQYFDPVVGDAKVIGCLLGIKDKSVLKPGTSSRIHPDTKKGGAVLALQLLNTLKSLGRHREAHNTFSSCSPRKNLKSFQKTTPKKTNPMPPTTKKRCKGDKLSRM